MKLFEIVFDLIVKLPNMLADITEIMCMKSGE